MHYIIYIYNISTKNLIISIYKKLQRVTQNL